MAPWLALILALLVAASIGLVNGVVTTGFGIPSFIATLAALLVVQGVDLVISGGNTIVYFGGTDVINGHLTNGQFYLFYQLLLQLVWPL